MKSFDEMDHHYKRIQEALDLGRYHDAVRQCNRLILPIGRSEDGEDKGIREKLIQLIYSGGMAEKLIEIAYRYLREGGGDAFGLFYELYKFECMALGEVSIEINDGMAEFYESIDDRMTAIGFSESLLEQYKEEGRDDLLEEAQKRVDKNIHLLNEKATHYQETGEYRYAFNSYRCLLECDFDCYEYHLGYLVNAIKSGKPKEAYNTILEEKDHRDYILRDDALQRLFYDLAQVVAADEERPDVLQ